jgi:hypothetical protein
MLDTERIGPEIVGRALIVEGVQGYTYTVGSHQQTVSACPQHYFFRLRIEAQEPEKNVRIIVDNPDRCPDRGWISLVRLELDKAGHNWGIFPNRVIEMPIDYRRGADFFRGCHELPGISEYRKTAGQYQ